MKYPLAINNAQMGMLTDVTCRILPQITQKKICENLRNLWLRARAGNCEMSSYNNM